MSIKRTTYKGLSFPEDDTYLNVRPAFTRMCMESKCASKLLSALIFKWDPGEGVEVEKVNTFSIQLTQAEIIKAMCDEATSKTIHDAAMPCLHLFGYADVDETTYPFTYTVHMDRVREGLSYCKQGPKQLEKVLIVWAREKGLDKPDGNVLNKKNFHIALEKVLIIIRETSNSIGNSSNSCGKTSNSRRGRKRRVQAVSTTQIEDPKNNKHSKHIEEQERESSEIETFVDAERINASPSFSELLAETDARIEHEFEDWLRIASLNAQLSSEQEAQPLEVTQALARNPGGGSTVQQPSVPIASPSTEPTPEQDGKGKGKRGTRSKQEITPEQKARTSALMEYIDSLLQEVTGDANEGFDRSTKVGQEALHKVLFGHKNSEQRVNPRRVRKIFTAMWNEPPNPRTGYWLRNNMSYNKFCEEFEKRIHAIIADENKGKSNLSLVQGTATQAPTELGGYKTWIPDDDTDIDYDAIQAPRLKNKSG